MSGPYKLLPCPFCGPGGSIVEPVKNDYGRWQIACGCCGLHGGNRPDNDLSKMAEHWNTRRPAYAAGRADAGDRIVALEKALEPFAREISKYFGDDGYPIYRLNGYVDVRAEDCVTARALLSPQITTAKEREDG